MTITLAFFLAYIPLGIFVCDISSNFLREETQEKVSILDPNFFQKDSTELPIPTLTKQGNYKSLKYSIRSKQAKLQEAYKHANDSTAKAKIINEAAFYITEQLINYLIPHWYGTPWAFDGYTAVPNQGTIGCSYFVSTTLSHVGFKLNRYRLAQQGPVSEAKSLAIDKVPLQLEIEESFDQFALLIAEKCEEGLYFIGLGHSHVGYLFYREQEIYFIQASYGKSMNVVIDYVNESDILTTFSNFTLTPITTNHTLIKQWLEGEELVIQKGRD